MAVCDAPADVVREKDLVTDSSDDIDGDDVIECDALMVFVIDSRGVAVMLRLWDRLAVPSTDDESVTEELSDCDDVCVELISLLNDNDAVKELVGLAELAGLSDAVFDVLVDSLVEYLEEPLDEEERVSERSVEPVVVVDSVRELEGDWLRCSVGELVAVFPTETELLVD